MPRDSQNFPLYDRFTGLFKVWRDTLAGTADIWNDAYKAAKGADGKANPNEMFGRWISDMMRTTELGAAAISSSTKIALLGDDGPVAPQWLTFNLRDDPAKKDTAAQQTSGAFIKKLDLDFAVGGDLKATLLTPLGQSTGRFEVAVDKLDVLGTSYTVTLASFATGSGKLELMGPKGPASLNELKAKAADAAAAGLGIANAKAAKGVNLNSEFVGFLYASGEGGGPPRAVVFVTL